VDYAYIVFASMQVNPKNICSLFTISLFIELSATIDISDAATAHSL
jgi:hypothetical protein